MHTFYVRRRKKMNQLDLLGSDLKTEFLNDLFEAYDVEVIYEYDRTYENLPDSFTAAIPKLGLEFIFDENQKLKTLFWTQVKVESFNPFTHDDRKVKIFDTKEECLRYAETNGLKASDGSGIFMDEEREWIRIENSNHSIHYEFVDTKLKMITLQKGNA